MAISLVGVAEASAANGGNVTLSLPAGSQEGDVVYIAGGHPSLTQPLGPQAAEGYTTVKTRQNDSTSDYNFGIWRKVLGPSPDLSVTCTGTGASVDACAYVAIVLRGVDNTTPEDVTVPTGTIGNSTNPDGPSITSITAGAWVISAFGSRINDTTVTAPTGYTNKVDVNGNDSGPSTVGLATKEIETPAAEDPAAWTGVSTGLWCALTVAVRPATTAFNPAVAGQSNIGEGYYA